MRARRSIMVTGGAGFIGSHTCKLLSKLDIDLTIYDNLSTGARGNLKWGSHVNADLLDRSALRHAFEIYRPTEIIHFAGATYVGESNIDPLKYYSINVQGTMNLLEEMVRHDVKILVFSSTCATYGIPAHSPIDERTPQRPINPYGNSKLAAEHLIKDCCAAYGINAAILRYFNAAGADPDGELGEYHDPETHLIPRCIQAAIGQIPPIELYGNDYDTPDGFCVRDYIHVTDLASTHIYALDYLKNWRGCLALNLGTGNGQSVLEVLKSVEEIIGLKVPYTIRPRRIGDPPVLVADGTLAKTLLNFAPNHSTIENIIKTAWNQYIQYKN